MQLREPTNRVSPNAYWLWLGDGVFWSAMVLCGVAAALSTDWSRGLGETNRNIIVGLAWLAAGVMILVVPAWRVRVHRWERGDDAFYVQSGWFVRERRIAPINRIQTVDLHRGPFSRMLGLANLTVTTASAKGPLKIEGLDIDVAEQLVGDLTREVAADDGDGT